MKKNKLYYFLCVTTILASASAGFAAEKKVSSTESKKAEYSEIKSDFAKALTEGKVMIDARYRYEFVDQANFANDAKASTLRTRVGYKTGAFHGLTGMVEMQNISAIGAEHYNDGGSTNSNGASSRLPTVVDPVGTELHQAYLEYAGIIPGTTINYGRHNIDRGNQRFIGSVAWRQNDQTQDGVTVTNKSIKDTEIFYGYSYNINRIFGSDDVVGDYSGNVHMADITNKSFKFITIMPYAYLIDVQNPRASIADGSQSYGLNLNGSADVTDGVKVLYLAEYAKQKDYGDNTTSYSADYVHGEIGASYVGITLKGGYEELGSDGGRFAFRTPLATLHKWNGWADQFLTTPANGLQDRYGSISYTINGIHEIVNDTNLELAYHDFSSDYTNTNYGTEWDFNIDRKFAKYYSAGIKVADYNSKHGTVAGNDVTKVIFSLGMKF